ncbi:hypothetical protein V8E53_008351 [Lactarius tabidus]
MNVNLEAHIRDITETPPEIHAGPPPTGRTILNPQLPTSAGPQRPQPQVASANKHQNGEAPAPEITDNLGGLQGEDSSDGLWSMYLTEAAKEDKEVTELWKRDTDGILVFTGMFSAVVVTFIRLGIEGLSPDSGDTTTQSGQLFKPTASAVRVNVLWFLSLTVSLSCALLATLVQQWARRYVRLMQCPRALHRRGRIRAYLFNGINRFRMTGFVATMPKLLYISFFLFLAGLVDFLFSINTTVAYGALGGIMASALAYAILANCQKITSIARLSKFTRSTFPLSMFRLLGSSCEDYENSSDRLWPMYLSEAEEEVKEVTGRWKRDADGILLSAGLFASIVTYFMSGSLAGLSPDSGNTNTRSGQPFKPTASAVRVNVLWFFSLVLSLCCALSATSLRQWARRYEELAQRSLAFPSGGRMRGYFFDNINRVGTERALRTMGILLHLSICLFLVGLVDFLFPISTTVAYAALGGISVFALVYATLTILPIIYLNCPYGTPLSGFTWSTFHCSVFGFLWTVLEIESLFHNALLKLRILANQQVTKLHGLEEWREMLKKRVKMHRQWFSQGLWKSIELSAYSAKSTVASALECTLTTLDDDKQIEDFATQLPGFFNSHIVPNAISAVLSLMSHQPNVDPVFGSRLNNLLKTCIPGTSFLDENVRKNRLRVCLNCLWHFGRAYNHPGTSQLLPSYFPNSLIPEVIRCIRTEEDCGNRVLGRCFVALIVNKLATDLELHINPISHGELACLSAILGVDTRDIKLLLRQPGAIALANMISLTFDDASALAPNAVPSNVLDLVQQTLDILSQAPSQGNAEVPIDQSISLIDGSDGKFERILVSHLIDSLNTCIQTTLPLREEVRTSYLRICSKGLWNVGRALNQLGDSARLPPDICIAFSNPGMTRYLREQRDVAVRVIGCCAGALVANKFAADINSRSIPPICDTELGCLPAILGTKSDDVMCLLSHPGVIEFTNMVFLALDDIYSSDERVPSYVFDVVQHTFGILSRAIPAELNAALRLDQIDSQTNGTLPFVSDMSKSALMWMKNLWQFIRESNGHGNSVPLPSSFCIAFTNPEMARRIHQRSVLVTRVIGRCVGALIVNKLAGDLKSRVSLASDRELAYLSALLGTESREVMLCLSQPGTVEVVNMASLALGDVGSRADQLPPGTRDIFQETLEILSQSLPAQEEVALRRDQKIKLDNVSDNGFERIIVTRLHGFLKMCVPGASSPTEEVRTSCLRMCLKSLWYCGKVYHHVPSPLPPYFPLVLASPGVTRYFHTERDLVARITGSCFGALIASKLVDSLRRGSHIPFSNHANIAELACISAILNRDHLPLPHLLHVINLRNVVSLMSSVINTLFTAAGMPTDVLSITQDTLYILANRLRDSMVVFGDVPMHQQGLLWEIHSEVVTALRSEWRKGQTVKTLDRLWRIMEKLLQNTDR